MLSNEKGLVETQQNQYDLGKLGVNLKSKKYKKYLNAGLLNDVDEVFLSNLQSYWLKHYGKEIDPVQHIAWMNFTGIDEFRIIPGQEMWHEIIPFFNDMDMRPGYSDKNIYDKIINPSRSAKIILKKVRGTYFDENNSMLNQSEAYKKLINEKQDLIIKPSNTDNGKGIEKLRIINNKISLNDQIIDMDILKDLYGSDFVVQEVIQQHPVIAKPHPNSVNTLRMVTLRWKNEIKYLLTFARFGANNSVKDNAGTGGVCVGVRDNGELMNIAIDENCFRYTHHPTTNYDFSETIKIPNFEEFKQFVLDLHKDILHHDFVSWDIAVGKDAKPIFIEANYRGATWLYQFAAQKPLFGDLTEEILDYISEELKKDKPIRDIYSKTFKLKKRNRVLKNKSKEIKEKNERLRSKNRKLRLKNNRLKQKNEEMQNNLVLKNEKLDTLSSKYDYIVKSKSWRYTSALRKFRRIFKK